MPRSPYIIRRHPEFVIRVTCWEGTHNPAATNCAEFVGKNYVGAVMAAQEAGWEFVASGTPRNNHWRCPICRVEAVLA